VHKSLTRMLSLFIPDFKRICRFISGRSR